MPIVTILGVDARSPLPRHVQVGAIKLLKKNSSHRTGGAMGAPASALYSLADENGVLAASRAGTGELFAQVSFKYADQIFSLQNSQVLYVQILFLLMYRPCSLLK